jgi:mono/diheme cytochrome c family protein
MNMRSFLALLFLASMPAIGATPSKANPDDARQVERGQLVYQRFCALCHGAKLEGQPEWRTRKPDGKLPAPPHDETGHTWHHPDELLFGIIKHGLVPPYAPPNYKSDMPAWGGTLKDDDIWAVLAYIKSRWPEETRKIQADIDHDARR